MLINKTILYHIASEVHFRNFLFLSKNFKNIKFVVLYDNNTSYIKQYLFSKKNKFEFIELNNNINETLKKIQNIKLIFVSSSQPRLNFFNIILWSLIKRIPIISIMETNQFLLHSGKINNYILPLNKLFLPTNYEKKELIKLNYKAKNLKVLGWPFLNSKINQINLNEKYHLNKHKKNLLIIFDASHKHNPTNQLFYSDFINTILILKKRFEKNYNFFIKFHPLDENNIELTIRSFLISDINIIRKTDVQKILPSFNLAITTGLSQSIIELILNETNFVIFPLKNIKINKIFKSIILSKDELSEKKIEKISFKSLSFKKNINCVHKKTLESKNKTIYEINKIINKRNTSADENMIREVLIWSLYFKEKLHIKKISTLLKTQNKINKSLICIVNDKQNINDYKILYNWSKNKLIFYPYINIYILYLIKNNLFEEKYFTLFFKIMPIDIYSIRIYFNNIKIFYTYLNLHYQKKSKFFQR